MIHDTSIEWYEILSFTEAILKTAWEDDYIDSEEASSIRNDSMAYSSNKLRKLWANGYLSRKKIILSKGGRKYRYKLTDKGIIRAQKINKKMQDYFD